MQANQIQMVYYTVIIVSSRGFRLCKLLFIVPKLRSLGLAHDSGEAANVITGDEFDEHIPPAVVMRHGIVEFRRDGANLRQAAAGHLGEVVVLVVISNIVNQSVKWAIVAVCFLTRSVLKMLSNQMATNRMKAHANQRAADHVSN